MYLPHPHPTRPTLMLHGPATRVGANSGYCRADGSSRAAQIVQPRLRHDRVKSAPRGAGDHGPMAQYLHRMCVGPCDDVE